jgi:hypothetical protein
MMRRQSHVMNRRNRGSRKKENVNLEDIIETRWGRRKQKNENAAALRFGAES